MKDVFHVVCLNYILKLHLFGYLSKLKYNTKQYCPTDPLASQDAYKITNLLSNQWELYLPCAYKLCFILCLRVYTLVMHACQYMVQKQKAHACKLKARHCHSLQLVRPAGSALGSPSQLSPGPPNSKTNHGSPRF